MNLDDLYLIYFTIFMYFLRISCSFYYLIRYLRHLIFLLSRLKYILTFHYDLLF
jgi:hypothetical protein